MLIYHRRRDKCVYFSPEEVFTPTSGIQTPSPAGNRSHICSTNSKQMTNKRIRIVPQGVKQTKAANFPFNNYFTELKS